MKEKKPFNKTHPSFQCSRVFSGPILSLKVIFIHRLEVTAEK